MARPWALYVEDEVGEATDRFQREIESAGFDVVRAYSAAEARVSLSEVEREKGMVDLLVLDRKLPERVGDRATEGTGDGLFREVEAGYPDVPLIVLTGFSDEDFTLFVLQRKNSLEIGLAEPVQRVTHIKKSRALNFREVLRVLGSALRETEGVALESEVSSLATRRVLKRVGQLFDGAVVHARPAVGGLSDAAVWLCDVLAADGRSLTSVVVKMGAYGDGRPLGGFMAALPPANVAAPSHLIAGACGGLCGHVAPLAGKQSVSLADVLGRDVVRAVVAVARVNEVLDGVESATTSIPLAAFVAPLIDWTRAEQIATEFAVELPDADLPVPTHLGCLHGDLHPGNVLLVQDRPVFIDFDRQRVGSLVLDGISLALGAVFNKAGPLRDRVPSLGEVEAAILGHLESTTWLGACCRPWSVRGVGQRERWAGALAYALRQLKYPDVVCDGARRDLAIALALRASAALRAS